jgi:hypothetical protein
MLRIIDSRTARQLASIISTHLYHTCSLVIKKFQANFNQHGCNYTKFFVQGGSCADEAKGEQRKPPGIYNTLTRL